MRTDRFEKLATLLETDANNPTGIKFDMNKWGSPAENSTLSFDAFHEEVAKKAVPLNCGTAACGWGLAAISGVFAADGLTYESGGPTDRYNLVPVFEGKVGFEAAEKFFELKPYSDGSKYVPYLLFDPGSYPVKTGRQAELLVASRIRRLISLGEDAFVSEYLGR